MWLSLLRPPETSSSVRAGFRPAAALAWAAFLALVASASGGPAPAAAASDPLPRRTFLGVELAPVPDSIRALAGLAEHEGVWIRGVVPGCSAAEAKLPAEAILLAIDGRPVGDAGAVVEALRPVPAGRTVHLELLRDGARLSHPVLLRELPRESSPDFEVVYGSVEVDGARFRTILTRPPGGGRHPAFYVVQGLGCFSVDNPLRPGAYGTLLGELTRRGYATFRVDKPGTGDSEGGPCPDVDFQQELRVYDAALAALRRTEGIDPERIFLFGHSMGGIMAPLLLRQEPVRGAIVYGTTFRNWMEYELENLRRQLRLGGTGPAEVEEAMADARLFNALFYPLRWTPGRIVREHPQFADDWPDTLHLHAGKTYRYFHQLYELNLAQLWGGTDAHVLAIHGTSDFVTSPVDHEAIAEAVNHAQPGKGTYLELEGTDHWLHLAATPELSLASGGQGEFNGRFVEEIDRWMRGVVP